VNPPSVIGTVITLVIVIAWIFGILLLPSNAAVGVLVILFAIALTYASSVWKREMRHQEVLEALEAQLSDDETPEKG
jgi:hypothetical protein